MSVDSLLHWAFDTTLAVSALVAIVLLIRKPVARFFGANAAYALWLAPAARLFMPQLNILPPPETLADSGAPVVVSYSFGAAPALQSAPLETGADYLALGGAFAITLWLLVALTLIGYALERHWAAYRAALRTSRPANKQIQALITRIARQYKLRRIPAVRVMNKRAGPSVIGIVNPLILLPENFETAYTAREQQLALAHETAHIARGDLLSAALASLMVAIQWPNPLAHLAIRAFRIDQEAACDETVLTRSGRDEKYPYITAIMKSVNGQTAVATPGLTLNHPLQERLMYLRSETKNKGRRFLGRGVAAAAIVTGVLGAASYGYADDDDKVKPTVKKEKRIMITQDGDEDFVFESFEGGGEYEIIIDGEGGGERKMIRRVHRDGEVEATEMTAAYCSSDEDGVEPVKLEWTDESGDGDQKHVEKSVICLTGEDAKPENRIAALERAIDRMEEEAMREEERRKRMIKGLREQLKEMEAAQ